MVRPTVELRWTSYGVGEPKNKTIPWPYGADLLPSEGSGVYHPESGVALGRVERVSWHLNKNLVVIQVGT